MKKITNVAALNAVRALVEAAPAPISSEFSNKEIADKLTAMITSFEKKSAAPKKPTAAQMENEAYREQVMEILADGVPKSTADLKVALGLPADTSPQRISGIMRTLVRTEKNPDGVVGTKEIKRKTHYFLIAEE